MIDINVTLWIQFVNFLLIVIFLNMFLFKPVLKMAEERAVKRRELEEKAESANKKTEAIIERYEENLAQMRRENAEQLSKARGEAEKNCAYIIEKAQAEFISKMETAKTELEKEKELVARSLKKDAQQFANRLTEKIIGRQV